jgi:ribosomal protein S12 methylthiotransferase accessory factor
VGIEEVIALDLTRPELGIAVARVVVPGLEGPDEHPAYLAGRRAGAAQERRP